MQSSRRRVDPVQVVLGGVGELLITVGLLLGLFVVWQLWWTDVVAGRLQDEVVADLGWDVPAAEPVVGDPARRDAPPVLPAPAQGVTFATLVVPRWGPDYERPVTEGVGRAAVLDTLGIGHYPGTAMPGEVGNFSLAGHRVTYNKPFHLVEELEPGDALVVRTEEVWYVYTVTETRVVLPEQVEVIAPSPGRPDAAPQEAMITLTTCHPMFSARERFVVHGVLDHWLPVADGTPVELAAGA
ncbi:class E sortase [Actinotalea sp. K2]|nr:class E sortase [Actinotalea sp. K2]